MVVVVDIETSGFPGQAGAAIIELGGVMISETGDVVAVFSSLVRGDAVGKGPHGIEVEMLQSAPEPWAVLGAWRDWLDMSPEPAGVYAYGQSFDASFLPDDVPWAESPCLRRAAHGAMRAQGALPLDKRGRKKTPNLGEAARHHGIHSGVVHRALPDALLAGRLLVALRKRGINGLWG